MRYGERERWLAKIQAEKGRRLKAFEGRPHVDSALIPYWHAFQELAERRQWGMSGPLPIPWQEIEAWLLVRGHRGAFREFVVEVVRRLDGEWLEVWAQQNSKSDGDTNRHSD